MAGNVSQEYATKLEREFKRYMTLILLNPDRRSLAPSAPVDMYWHLFILDIKNYAKFCNEIFGKFIDHVPSTTMETKTAARGAYSRTLLRYKEIWGDADTRYWNGLKRAEDCGHSNADGCGQGCNACGQGG